MHKKKLLKILTHLEKQDRRRSTKKKMTHRVNQVNKVHAALQINKILEFWC